MSAAERSEEKRWRSGPLAWMAENSVTANLLMLVLVVGGLLFVGRIKQEVFPETTLDFVTVTVAYPGASPAEVEQGIVLAVEEAIQGIDGVKEVRSVAMENTGTVTAELLLGADPDQALNDIKSAVDRITSFPREAEEPVISVSSNRREVVSLVLHGNLDRKSLHRLAERVRSELLLDRRITVVEISGLPPPEISIEISQEQLRRYGLSLEEIASRVRAASIELGGGGVKTPGGEILLRTSERRDLGEEFERITVVSHPDGTVLRLGELGEVIDGFRDTDQEAYYNGERAVRLAVFRVGEQTPIEISEAVRGYVERASVQLPNSVQMAIWNDSSELYEDRLRLLLRNGFLGMVLVLLVLGLFLQLRLAFWVMLGMAASFVGAFLFMPALGVSINMISLFAFLLVLGIVVDDAIVVGEAIYYQARSGRGPLEAAVLGVREVAGPVTFSVVTTVFAFLPLLFVPGVTGKFFSNIPLIVIPILLLSLFESVFILPAHLAYHGGSSGRTGLLGRIHRMQQRFSDWVEHFVERRYGPMAERMLKHRYATAAISLAILILALGLIGGGRVKFHYFPNIEGDIIRANVALPFGAPVQQTRDVLEELMSGLDRVVKPLGGEERLVRGIYAEVGRSGVGEMNLQGGTPESGSHLASVAVFLVGASDREITAAELARRWRREVGEVPGVERLAFTYGVGPPTGAKVSIELAHRDSETLRTAAARLAGSLETYEGVFDIDDGFSLGKEQLDLRLKPAARAFGVTEQDLARQVRSAFFGAEALRQQRGRDEVRVYVRRPERERESEFFVKDLKVRTPGGGEIPLDQAADIKRTRSYTEIQREQGRQVVIVSADVDPEVTSGGAVTADIKTSILPELIEDFPGLTYELSGEQQEQEEAIASLKTGVALAFFGIFALLAVAFRSYAQPAIVLFAIPFGVVGAMIGHVIMGYDMSLISIFGIVALSGVVVNDSLVLITAINQLKREGRSPLEAVSQGSIRRFRAIWLTSLTTFFGLAPMIFETSMQARFLIPMAISLGFGVLFATLITLVLVPAAYLIVEDARVLAARGAARARRASPGGAYGH